MTEVAPQRMSSEPAARLSPEVREQLRNLVDEAISVVAQSWPMKTFAYRNSLRGFEHLPFDEAVPAARDLLGGNGYLPNEDYRQLYREGRIADRAIDESLQRLRPGSDAPTVAVGNRQIARADVLRQHLLHGLDSVEPGLLDWHLATGRFRPDLPTSRSNGDRAVLENLWDRCLSAVKATVRLGDSDQSDFGAGSEPKVDLPASQTISDWLSSLTGAALVDEINDQMIKWNAAFLDEGMADWEMPGRKHGFYRAWRELAPRDWSGRLIGIKRFAKKVRDLPDSPEDAISLGLDRLGIPEERRAAYLSRMFSQLSGWSGFIRWLGDNPSYPAQKDHPIEPVQYLAVRLFYETELVHGCCRREWGIEGTLSAIVAHWERDRDDYQRLVNRSSHLAGSDTEIIRSDAWRLFNLAQLLELSPEDVESIAAAGIQTLLGWLDGFPADQHGMVWLQALEASIGDELVQRLSNHRGEIDAGATRPRAQIVMCIDARSESLRRHIEARGPYETFGFAGFFGVPLSYQAFDTTGHAALCPVIATPAFEVSEVPRPSQDEPLTMYASGSRFCHLGQHLFHDLKSNPFGSLMLIDALGLFFSLRLIGKTILSKQYESIKTWARRWFVPQVATQIPLERDPEGERDPEALPHGFTAAEQAKFLEGGMRAFGLTENFGRFIVICGHGSTADNNPYFAAYNCGACGGGHGDPNARVFASMGNRPEVRSLLRENNLDIPEDTWFLAGKHNTATDKIEFYDVEDVPASHAEDLRDLIEDLERARAQQALERCRRLPGAPKRASPEAAVAHMVSRTMDWSNVRPEWGLSSNAAFILGRRALTKGLDLGARTFLHSYDPDSDTDGAILGALMNAPLVVAQWISMEYYFSSVDPSVYGSGSKVTHNVVSGVGVMHGAHGDLESGLPVQSVNDGARHYHEPVRLLAVLEAPTERVSNVIREHVLLQNLFHNQWVHLVAIDPATGEFHRYGPDGTWARYPPPTPARPSP